MGIISELVSIFFGSWGEYKLSESTDFYSVVGVAILLAIVFWLVCSNFTRLFNVKFQVKPLHHFLCFIAAAITFVSVVGYKVLEYTEVVALFRITQWEKVEIANDADWKKDTFMLVHDEIKNLRNEKGEALEDFSNVKDPRGSNISEVPAVDKRSREVVYEVYSEEVTDHFKEYHPFLSKILWGDENPLEKAIKGNVDSFIAQSPASLYFQDNIIRLTSKELNDLLEKQTPRVVAVGRAILVCLFIVFQIIPFGLIGYSAYRDIKVRRYQG